MHELQSLLLQKLPRLGELTFGCMVQKKGEHYPWIWIGTEEHPKMDGTHNILIDPDRPSRTRRQESLGNYEILGHPFTHADILEALGIEYAMFPTNRKDFQIMSLYKGTWDMLDDNSEMLPRLPQNLSDLALPEYEETRKQLISLLK